ncbi:MAG: hypothetical protein LUQ70_04615 [Methanobacteriaceae archaeon]|nr:hypothetical protein [Methanobacteriaceae archaeon]
MAEENLLNRLKEWVQREKEPSRASFVVAIIVNLILIYIVNQVPNWDISFITSSWSETLWILNLSLVVTIIGNFLFLFYHRQWFRSLAQIVMNVFVFWAVLTLYNVFPFTFSQSYMVFVTWLVLILIMVGVFISILVEMVKLVVSLLD